MPHPEPFPDWFDRIKAGDPDATAEMIRQVSPMLQSVIRTRLAQYRLARMIDVADVSQTVLGLFFIRVARGGVDLTAPEQLRGLLVIIAHNVIRDEARRQRAGRRDHRRLNQCHPELDLWQVASTEPCPSRTVATKELYQLVIRQMTADERVLFEERLAGREWAEIATKFGTNTYVVRKRLSRALLRIRVNFQKREDRPTGGAADQRFRTVFTINFSRSRANTSRNSDIS